MREGVGMPLAEAVVGAWAVGVQPDTRGRLSPPHALQDAGVRPVATS